MAAMTTSTTTTAAPGVTHSRAADLAAFVAGSLAAALGIAVGELLAGLLVGAPSLIIAVGDTVIEYQPPWGKDLAIALFGTNDKLAVNVGIILAAIGIAGILGVIGRRDWRVPLAGFVVAGLAGLVAAITRPLVDPALAVVTIVAAIGAALGALYLMLAATAPRWRRQAAADGTTSAAAGSAMAPTDETQRGSMPDWDRRRFLQVSGGVAVGAVVMGVVGRNLLTGRSAGGASTAQLPTSSAPLPEVPPAASLDVQGITPIVMPNDKFYRIDTALISPKVNADTWQLKVHGLVDREVTLTYEDLQAMPLFEQYVTIACVSNEVGGRLVGNALWTGVDLRDVLDMAGVQPEAEQIVGRSVDDFTAGFPTAWAMDPDRRPMIAIGMNGQPLPVDHGFPARLIIPGLYGYVSATKWLREIELTTWDGFDGYWVPLGWAKEGPILTQSRIDTPRSGSSVASGTTVPIAGVAWAPDRGVAGVEVRIDDSEWQQAEISAPLSDATWVQWKLPWSTPAEGGRHQIQVRATDGTGETQTAEVTSPRPDGARGYHTISVGVS
jgi:DMSO/TMAO reductase YedYZ molybdopterin-dependent catalytic subunit